MTRGAAGLAALMVGAGRGAGTGITGLGVTGVSTMVEALGSAGFGAALESITVALPVACAGSLESSCGELALLCSVRLLAETACVSGLVVMALLEALLPAVTLLGSTRVMSVGSAFGDELLGVLEVVLELAAWPLDGFGSGAFVLEVVALGGFMVAAGVLAVAVLEAGLSAGIAAAAGVVVACVFVPGGVLAVALEAELAGSAGGFVLLRLGVPRKSRETKPPTTSKIRVIIKVSTQFRRHQPIGFMALLYPLSV